MKLLMTAVIVLVLAGLTGLLIQLPTDVHSALTIEHVDDVVLVTQPDGSTETIPIEFYAPSDQFDNIDWDTASYGGCWSEASSGNIVILFCRRGEDNCDFTVDYEDGTKAVSITQECEVNSRVLFNKSTKRITLGVTKSNSRL